MRHLKYGGSYYRILDDQTCIEVENSTGEDDKDCGIRYCRPFKQLFKYGSPITSQQFEDALLKTQLELSVLITQKQVEVV